MYAKFFLVILHPVGVGVGRWRWGGGYSLSPVEMFVVVDSIQEVPRGKYQVPWMGWWVRR